MQPKYAILFQPEQEEISTSQHFAQMLESFLAPLLLVLDQVLDKRLVRTLVQCCVAILRFRNSKQALLLSELGSYMGGYRGSPPRRRPARSAWGSCCARSNGAPGTLIAFCWRRPAKR